MNDGVILKGVWKFDIYEKGVLRQQFTNNLITTVGKSAVAKILSLEVGTEIFQYVAFGDDNTAPVVGNTQLGSEIGRIVPDSIIRAANTITVTAQVGVDEMNGFIIQEVGIFGVDATSSVNTGNMLSRAIVSPSIAKNGTIVINATYELTIN